MDERQKYHYEFIKRIAAERGGTVLSGEYVNSHTKMEFVDAAGRRFQMTPANVKAGKWSPFESGLSRDPQYHLSELSKIAVQRGGYVEDGQKYVNSSTKLWFVDALGNRFQASPNNVKNGKWSPFESRKVRDPEWHMADLARIAEDRGGRLEQGQTYVDTYTKVWFVDAAGNRFQMAPSNVKQGKWSPYESKRVRDPDWHMAELARIAEGRGGRLEAGQEYCGHDKNLWFVDSQNNRFKMRPSVVKRGGWSPYEANQVRDPDWHMAELARIAEGRGGWLEDGQTYVGTYTKLWFVDAAGNRFQASPLSVKAGHWSPYEGFISEHVCRQAIQHLFGAAFPSRWDVIRRPNGNKLQLDGFCEEHAVAFEYQGPRHRECDDQRAKDAEKRIACMNAGIVLVEVDEFDQKEKYRSEYVLDCVTKAVSEAYNKAGRSLPSLKFKDFEVDLKRIGHNVRQQAIRIQYIEANHPGARLEEGQTYINKTTKLLFVDAAGNRFAMTSASVKRGYWSPYETGNVCDPNWHMSELERIAAERGGRLEEGQTYINKNKELWFIDSAGNRFKMRPDVVKRGGWSPYESGTVRDAAYHMAHLARIAAERGGRLGGGQEYTDNKSKMCFTDASGNQFWASASNIKCGKWSPFESNLGGALRTVTNNGCSYRIVCRSGDIVIYDKLPDGALRIREHQTSDGLQQRRWKWATPKAGDVVLVYRRSSIDLPFRLWEVQNLDGQLIPSRGRNYEAVRQISESSGFADMAANRRPR